MINAYPTAFYPDGLTPDLIDALMRDVADTLTEHTVTTRLSRPVLDATTADRRDRRTARRALAAVVRTLPAADSPDPSRGDNDGPAAVVATWGGAA